MHFSAAAMSQLAESQVSTSITPFSSRERLDGLVARAREIVWT
jgi:hypothetical protein